MALWEGGGADPPRSLAMPMPTLCVKRHPNCGNQRDGAEFPAAANECGRSRNRHARESIRRSLVAAVRNTAIS